MLWRGTIKSLGVDEGLAGWIMRFEIVPYKWFSARSVINVGMIGVGLFVAVRLGVCLHA